MAADVEQLSEINEIGPIIAQSVYDFLHSEFGRQTIDDLQRRRRRRWSRPPPAAAARGRWKARRSSSPAR